MQVTQNEAIKLLKSGGVIGIATDTVYGFAALPEFAEEIYNLKRRDRNKKLINFIHTEEQINKVDDLTKKEIKDLASNFWPGAVTLIFTHNKELVSYRIPNQETVLKLLKQLNKIVVTTSANISGEDPCLNAEEFERRFPNIPLLEDKTNAEISQKPSSIYLVSKAELKQVR